MHPHEGYFRERATGEVRRIHLLGRKWIGARRRAKAATPPALVRCVSLALRRGADGLNPFTMSQMLSDNSQAISGSVRRKSNAEVCSMSPNSSPVAYGNRSGSVVWISLVSPTSP
jgi:hypothetical protein